MRGLLAKRRSNGLWLERVDRSETKTLDDFTASVAEEFGLLIGDIKPVEVDFVDSAAQEQVSTALRGGLYQGIAVVSPPIPAMPGEYSDELRQGVGGIFGGTAAQKWARMVDVVELYPALGTALNMLRGKLVADARAFVRETVSRVRTKIGTSAEILTATEYQNLKTLADGKGLGALVPPL